ncbi:TonB-dependent receptor domain-containing protein [Sphingomonas sp.]|uniref:TonB-dependent receptor plug domain-containing protein n=1 Tax=Sphingomonas sp. TaxID=28214 RepID=UPI00286DCB1A|nr:TonB-dependent receptor [Sphingomonas sp.]
MLPLIILAAADVARSPPAAPETIEVTAVRPATSVLPPAVALDQDSVIARQPRSAADVLKGLPGVSVRTNSRGETIARVRGSEERQTQVFVDGAPLAVPWDGRADLGMIPAGLIGALRVSKGAAPIEFGTNAVAGAVDVQTRSGGEHSLIATASAGPLGFAEGSAVLTFPTGGIDVTLGASGLTRDAEPVARLAALPFSQRASRRRTNSDLDAATLFAAAGFERGPVTLRGTLLHIRAERGIAPESDRDPALDAPRYWRYPDIAQTQASVTAKLALAGRTSLRVTGWRQWFGQTIVQYSDASYDAVRAREEDDDDTLGGRAVLSLDPGPVALRLVATAQTRRHAQVDSVPGGPAAPRLRYRQNLFTIGAEADRPIAGGQATVGLAYDHSANPLTGDKPDHPARGALAFSAAYRRPLAKHWTATLSGGRRNRFPTARELFGEALGRFLANPDLRPERAWSGDLELAYASPGLSVTLNPFFSRSEDSIAQRVVTVDGRRLRQRYNLSGSTSFGLDAALSAELAHSLRLELGGSLLRARADRGAAAFRRLPQRPGYELATALAYEPNDRLSLRGEWRRVGPAVDIDPRGEKARLAPGNEVNLRGRVRVAELRGRLPLSLTASIDNLADDVITPQLGLPLPGRSVRIGLRIN